MVVEIKLKQEQLLFFSNLFVSITVHYIDMMTTLLFGSLTTRDATSFACFLTII